MAMPVITMPNMSMPIMGDADYYDAERSIRVRLNLLLRANRVAIAASKRTFPIF